MLLGTFFAIVAGSYVACDRRQALTNLHEDASATSENDRVTYLWHAVPDDVRKNALPTTRSNIHPADYKGPESCKECHEKNYENWSHHSHRKMNAEANDENVVGDFGGVAMSYLGGTAEFFRRDGRFLMSLRRGSVSRTFVIDRTIGSRFFQYYVGRMIDGPEPENHLVRHRQNVLPLGYWLTTKEWVPIVHVDTERPDGERDDPFAERLAFYDYDQVCAACHTTLPAGNWMVWRTGVERLKNYSPRSFAFAARDYLEQHHSSLIRDGDSDQRQSFDHIDDFIFDSRVDLAGRKHAINLGISCESCHFGSREHVQDPKQPPLFFAAGNEVYIPATDETETWGRTPENVNWTCARCHSGARPTYAGGIHTWNSTEYADAIRGGNCYSRQRAEEAGMHQLTCVKCHDPHKTIGQKWTASPHEDDRQCLDCHQQFVAADARQAHTRHQTGSSGDRCMNCHMPKINEGLQDMVRTHHIFSPTNSKMLESNQPNACNMCHLDRSIDWTLEHLQNWYGARSVTVSSKAIDVAYDNRDGPVGLGWLKSPDFATRLVAVDAYCRQAELPLPHAIFDALDDPYLVNRQFAQRSLEARLGEDFRNFGYRFYMTPEERADPLKRLRDTYTRRLRE